MKKIRIALYILAIDSDDADRQKKLMTSYIRTHLSSCPCTIFTDYVDSGHVQYNRMMFDAYKGIYQTIVTCSHENVHLGILKVMRLTGLNLITLDDQSYTTIITYSKGGIIYGI